MGRTAASSRELRSGKLVRRAVVQHRRRVVEVLQEGHGGARDGGGAPLRRREPLLQRAQVVQQIAVRRRRVQVEPQQPQHQQLGLRHRAAPRPVLVPQLQRTGASVDAVVGDVHCVPEPHGLVARLPRGADAGCADHIAVVVVFVGFLEESVVEYRRGSDGSWLEPQLDATLKDKMCR
ncbi:unnamed protein product [Plutella xylostella]|uniref:(diamondback moth) hypothetical protein n=1 Tax=Plutella xylostella TaxID=51655 RepID=A0A8S4GE96_PLUXY|nr:unnamed protein product [Plutella xylostella]